MRERPLPFAYLRHLSIHEAQVNEKPQRILIVDDEVDNCANLADIFCEFGYVVDTAYDGASALTLLRQHNYDVALLDLRMPGMSGLDLYQHVKRMSADTVVFIVTAYASSESAKATIEAGALSLVSKPVDATRLIALVEKAMRSPLILVVDDDSELCTNLCDIFHHQKIRILTANDSANASRALQQKHFHVILVDMKLPDGHGSELLEVIKTLNPLAKTIVVTGYMSEMESRVQDAVAGGANAVIYKPFNINHLIQTVMDLSQSSRTNSRL